MAVHNLAARSVRARLCLEAEEGATLVELFRPGELPLDGGEVEVDLDPFGFAWYRLRRPGGRVAP